MDFFILEVSKLSVCSDEPDDGHLSPRDVGANRHGVCSLVKWALTIAIPVAPAMIGMQLANWPHCIHCSDPCATQIWQPTPQSPRSLPTLVNAPCPRGSLGFVSYGLPSTLISNVTLAGDGYFYIAPSFLLPLCALAQTSLPSSEECINRFWLNFTGKGGGGDRAGSTVGATACSSFCAQHQTFWILTLPLSQNAFKAYLDEIAQLMQTWTLIELPMLEAGKIELFALYSSYTAHAMTWQVNGPYKGNSMLKQGREYPSYLSMICVLCDKTWETLEIFTTSSD